MAKWPQTCPVTPLHISVNECFQKEVDSQRRIYQKIEKMLEGAMMKAHIYERYFTHEF